MLKISGIQGDLSACAPIAYALPSLFLATLSVTFYVFVPKLYADLGTVTIGTLGTVVLASRMWDAVTDPLIGVWSDRTRAAIGRRKPWLKYSVVPLCVSFLALFVVGRIPEHSHLLWFSIWSFLFFVAWTAYAIPYDALGQELVTDHNDRTVLFSFRDGAFVLGTLIAATIPFIAHNLFASVEVWNRWFVIGLGYSVLLIVFTTLLIVRVPNGTQRANAEGVGILPSMRETLKNSHFRLLVSAYTVASFGAALPATLFLFYVDSVLRSNNGPAYLALYFAIGIAALPLWIKLSRRWGKKRAWLGALSINTSAFLGVFFLGPGQELLYVILISISALGYAAAIVLPASMQADVIDSEELRTGLRKEGAFLGVWSFAKKSAAAIGAGAALWILGVLGFQTGQVEQSSEALVALRTLYCLVPCLCSAAAMALLRNYTLGKSEHERILAAIRARVNDR